MPQATRIEDTTSGICDVGCEECPHGRTGTNETGSPDVFFNNKKAHRKGDGGSIACPHGGYFRSTGGSTTVFINGKSATRIGDSTVCEGCGQGGNHSSGSPDIFIN